MIKNTLITGLAALTFSITQVHSARKAHENTQVFKQGIERFESIRDELKKTILVAMRTSDYVHDRDLKPPLDRPHYHVNKKGTKEAIMLYRDHTEKGLSDHDMFKFYMKDKMNEELWIEYHKEITFGENEDGSKNFKDHKWSHEAHVSYVSTRYKEPEYLKIPEELLKNLEEVIEGKREESKKAIHRIYLNPTTFPTVGKDNSLYDDLKKACDITFLNVRKSRYGSKTKDAKSDTHGTIFGSLNIETGYGLFSFRDTDNSGTFNPGDWMTMGDFRGYFGESADGDKKNIFMISYLPSGKFRLQTISSRGIGQAHFPHGNDKWAVETTIDEMRIRNKKMLRFNKVKNKPTDTRATRLKHKETRFGGAVRPKGE